MTITLSQTIENFLLLEEQLDIQRILSATIEIPTRNSRNF